MAILKKEPRSKFYELLQQQIQNEFTASQQYVALAVWFDNSDLPQLAKFFYRQALEERNHALAITQYLMDTEHHVEIPRTGEIRNDFTDAAELVELALEQEKEVAADFRTLMKAAREEDDYQGEQFLQWFLKEQVEEVSTMSTLLNVVRRSNGNLFDVETYLVREALGGDAPDAEMPPVAGGAL
ncbi:ferritin [Amycolatopsis bartoniae]|uniref:Ferritin n=1 Tax=Amycolatopsis bartoniae TaxID=941986 RepID=A0A8H9IVH7_9PSEU|nr:ferritin [Amycolatopsis bartoniae]MBB2933344.1 ferritin [Amycolatopsis bartoniae]TVT08052.1 ferritin [Amycolatopsis bartoniae]GHF58849.1 ferritin [Amycolatopsis bartoniae]